MPLIIYFYLFIRMMKTSTRVGVQINRMCVDKGYRLKINSTSDLFLDVDISHELILWTVLCCHLSLVRHPQLIVAQK